MQCNVVNEIDPKMQNQENNQTEIDIWRSPTLNVYTPQ